MDPTSDAACHILRDTLQLSSEQHQQLAKLAVLVNAWNSDINLISRKDCSRDVVFGRHILPSLAPLSMFSESKELQLLSGQSVCDVGTGGGFPGLPMAIARPDLDFLLVDSVGKKIRAVQDMADQLGLKNVHTFHGRAESLPSSRKFDWVMGRSVAAIPTYAFWVNHLLKKKSDDEKCGYLVYLIGGDVDDSILNLAVHDEDISELLKHPFVSDKRVLVFPQPAVHELALASGEKLRVPRGGSQERRPGGKNKKLGSGAKTRGQWQRRDITTPKSRGYEGFRRYDSLDKE
ncbi:ribosomal RNA small subunit methyltransferase G [Nitzschia inconspicua]|uniref:Ribosomal RNA small subunit methyltransferase G n=1 Tax=Nitzschia inconspicua TaxID=303405 RepID=A0A9K3P8P4_9STRA|nr:ribosomal RNA small subunit methyltransferase G [Nitzschia inconspicua]KAG7340480.1 ribosomal RNA small subunit methyltransferase G [Nitzschia inconspicua]